MFTGKWINSKKKQKKTPLKHYISLHTWEDSNGFTTSDLSPGKPIIYRIIHLKKLQQLLIRLHPLPQFNNINIEYFKKESEYIL